MSQGINSLAVARVVEDMNRSITSFWNSYAYLVLAALPLAALAFSVLRRPDIYTL
jgi:hypothetical protein